MYARFLHDQNIDSRHAEKMGCFHECEVVRKLADQERLIREAWKRSARQAALAYFNTDKVPVNCSTGEVLWDDMYAFVKSHLRAHPLQSRPRSPWSKKKLEPVLRRAVRYIWPNAARSLRPATALC